jgi:hypothetical protein
MNEPFRIETLQKIIADLTPTLYYGLTEFAERGQVYICKETEWYPKFVILHPEDFEQFKREISPIRLVEMRLEPAQKRMERFRNRMAHHLPESLQVKDRPID